MRITYTIDLTSEAWLALVAHGYDPTLPPRGVSGPPGRIDGYVIGEGVHMPLRNHVCYLDGVEVDGHEGSELDPNAPECLHCDGRRGE